MKIQDLLAVVGGILKALMTLFQVVSHPHNQHSLIDYLKIKVEKSEPFKLKQKQEEGLQNNQNKLMAKLNESRSETSKHILRLKQ
jgi:hypothetical protein